MQLFQRSESKGLKKPKSVQRNKSSLFLIYLGLIIFIFGAFNYYRVRILSFSKAPPITTAFLENLDIPAEIMVPSLKMNLKVDPGNINGGVWAISRDNATFLTTSSPPGSGGNTVIYGHNKKSIFGNIPYVSVGQEIKIKTVTGQIYNYVVSEKYFVKPDRVDLVSPTETSELTIYTCWGLFDSQRAVIKAKPILN